MSAEAKSDAATEAAASDSDMRPSTSRLASVRKGGQMYVAGAKRDSEGKVVGYSYFLVDILDRGTPPRGCPAIAIRPPAPETGGALAGGVSIQRRCRCTSMTGVVARAAARGSGGGRSMIFKRLKEPSPHWKR